ncbi:uncharacterized protein MELLADRAFT_95531 [Melampsora larici-populina 98AG31]|uniref:Uncharacterized protein n=1 Tax=Melampsora larici-populina (strain 98AG31 / pathotype 3-4-7) TaxID=747676 RepID=F4S9N8_MELLP|nr:uncharacterized protein MELLADRAFT_95531 [Melampsora larici-populina 98AG31]EGF98638.1 hypothetical protein MELLADRAFT_95531 [Melampsora larici-populina 98AG31]
MSIWSISLVESLTRSSSATAYLKLSSLSTRAVFQPHLNCPAPPFPFDYYNFIMTCGLHCQKKVKTRMLLQEGLQMKASDKWASRCPRCFGPAQGKHKGSTKEPDVIIWMDGNFQHRHNILASRENPPETQYPSIFVPPSQIAQLSLTAQPVPAVAVEDPCSEAHKAADDTRGKSTWDQCDDTGLFAAACRHDVPLAMANIYQSGENVLKRILHDFPDDTFGVLYDIGCHLDKHIKLGHHEFIFQADYVR